VAEVVIAAPVGVEPDLGLAGVRGGAAGELGGVAILRGGRDDAAFPAQMVASECADGESGRFSANWRTLDTASGAAARYESHPHPVTRSAATKSGLAPACATCASSRRERCKRQARRASAPKSGYHMTSARWCHRSG